MADTTTGFLCFYFWVFFLGVWGTFLIGLVTPNGKINRVGRCSRAEEIFGFRKREKERWSRTWVLERGLLLPLASVSLAGELEPADDGLETAKLPLERLRAARPELKERPDLASWWWLECHAPLGPDEPDGWLWAVERTLLLPITRRSLYDARLSGAPNRYGDWGCCCCCCCCGCADGEALDGWNILTGGPVSASSILLLAVKLAWVEREGAMADEEAVVDMTFAHLIPDIRIPSSGLSASTSSSF